MNHFLFYLSDWISSVFRVGYLPLAPGTWGSLFALLVWWFLPPDISNFTYILIILNLFLIGVITSSIISYKVKENDPSKVVIDEWVGMWIALIGVPKIFGWMVLSFVLFRFFDIIKIFPARRLEKIRGGWGIMLDDVVAGVYTLIILIISQGIYRLV